MSHCYGLRKKRIGLLCYPLVLHLIKSFHAIAVLNVIFSAKFYLQIEIRICHFKSQRQDMAILHFSLSFRKFVLAWELSR